MILRRILLLSFLLWTMSATIYGQKFKKFSEDSEVFLSELNELFAKITVKKNKQACENMMEHFIDNWNSGVFTTEIKQNTRSICNKMLKRRMKPYPHYYHYLSSLNGLMDFDHSVSSYLAWNKSVDTLVKEKRSTKPFTSYVKSSFYILNENILY